MTGMDMSQTPLEQSAEFRLQNCGVTKLRIDDAAAMSYPTAVIGQSCGGKVWTQLRGRAPQRVPSRAGYVIPPNVPIRSWTEGRGHSLVRWAHVSYTLLGAVDLFQVLEIPLLLPIRTGEEIGAINEEQVQILKSPDPYGLAAMARRKELGFRLLGLLLKFSRPNPDAVALLSGHARVQPALDYIQQHLAEPLNRATLARRVHLSESRFHDVFKQATGVTSLEYVRRLRMRRAQELLLGSDFSIAEIGRQCGFSDQFHFSRQFKNSCGQSPQRYRTLASKAGVRAISPPA
jgi:AraC-like DNA-binding protein